MKMKGQQGNLCAICKESFQFKKYAIHIDHDHVSGRIRGLLCRSCNLLLGHAKDNIAILRQCIQYLNDAQKN
jgi:hypothetical protein